jgi:hypothetical protein
LVGQAVSPARSAASRHNTSYKRSTAAICSARLTAWYPTGSRPPIW